MIKHILWFNRNYCMWCLSIVTMWCLNVRSNDLLQVAYWDTWLPLLFFPQLSHFFRFHLGDKFNYTKILNLFFKI